jgi:23S rRNA pseudouridine2605 synthase
LPIFCYLAPHFYIMKGSDNSSRGNFNNKKGRNDKPSSSRRTGSGGGNYKSDRNREFNSGSADGSFSNFFDSDDKSKSSPRRSDSKSNSRFGDKPFKKDSDKPFRKDSDRSFDRPSRGDSDRSFDKPFRKDSDRSFDRPSRGDSDRSFDKPFRKDSDRSFDRPSRGDSDRSFDKPFRKDSDRSFDRPSRGDSDRSFDKPFRKDSDRSFDRPSRGDSDRSFDKPFRKESDRSFDRPSRGDSDRSFDKPFRKDSDRSFDRPTRGDSERSFDKPFRKDSDRSFDRPSRGDSDRSFDKPYKKFEGGDDDRSFKKPSYRSGDSNSEGFSGRRSKPFNRNSDRSTNNVYAPPTSDGTIRLNRYISNAGVCSRREADELITTGVISVNGKIITDLGTKVKLTDVVLMEGQKISQEKKVYILLNKPKDYITTADDPEDRKTVMNLIKDACRERLYPVGRLDRNTTGVLLMTNDGELTKKLTHPKYQQKKLYHVFLDKPLTKADFESIENGVELEDGFIKVDAIDYVSKSTTFDEVGLEIHSGRNRIVRRIFENLGYRVVKLDRVMFSGLTKKDLPRGRWRFLTPAEVSMLYAN